MTLRLAAIFVPCVLFALPAAAQVSAGRLADELTKTDAEIATLRDLLKEVEKGYGRPIAKHRGSQVERRLREGEIHFLLGDYLRASIVLLDVVEGPSNRSHPRYDDCLYFLGQSLRRTENYDGARQYFEDLLPRAAGERLNEVVLALLEIASATSRYEGVDGYIARLRAAGGMAGPEVDYIHGKMLYREARASPEKLDAALAKFASVPDGVEVAPQAAYYAGVVRVTKGDLEPAVMDFARAADRASASKTPGAIKELAQLALGRLHHELGQPNRAVDAYNSIAHDSPHFADMLFEVAWTHVKAANSSTVAEVRQRNLTLALRTAELLMATGPDHQMFPEAKILEGNLQIHLGAPETAYATFESIIARYGGARDKLEELMGSIGEPQEFFEQIVAEDLGSVGATAFLPPLALEWAERSSTVRRAVTMIKSMDRSEADLDESRTLIRTMNEALRGEQRYEMFTGLGEARKKAFGIENRLVLANRRLLQLERLAQEPHLAKGTIGGLDVLRARRRALEEDVRALPRTTDEVEAAHQRIRNQYTEVDMRVFRQSSEISAMRAQVAAVEVWLAENRRTLTPEELRLMADRVSMLRSALADLDEETDELGADVTTARAVSGGDGGRVRAQRVRDAYATVMDEEVKLLRLQRSRLPAKLATQASKMDQQRAELDSIAKALTRLQVSLDDQIDEEVSEVRRRLAVELRRLEDYETEQKGLRGESDEMLGPLAQESLQAVAQEFRNLVQRADVGIIDVAWARKQQESDRVNELVQKQQQQVRSLEDTFSEVSEDDEE